jgi:hypothetical protein
MPERSGRRLRILFLLYATNYDRVFENFLTALLERGHEVDLRIDVDKRRPHMGSGLVLDRLAERFDTFSFQPAVTRTDPWLAVATRWRLGLDYLRYREPEYEHADALRNRARQRAPRWLRVAMERTPLGRPPGDRLIGRALRALEAAVPVPDSARELIASSSADVVIVSPLVGLGSAQGDYVRAAQALGVPVVYAVASWDNLTNKGRLREVPDRTIVWNAPQIEEAVALHDLPRERVEAVGAHAFDHWFTFQPSTKQDEFARKLGLPEGRPLLLYVCSSSFIARSEVEFVNDWLRHLRSSPHPELREANVIVRPHPQHALQWHEDSLPDPGAVVFPTGGVAPIAEQAKIDYFDSLHHCRAVIGINTSAQVEAAILKRPVYTLLDKRFAHTQGGTLHFAYLTGTDEAGVVTAATTWEQHLDQLAAGVRDPASTHARLEAFVGSFIRPAGVDVAAAPRAAEAVERTAAAGRAAAAERSLTRVLETLTPLIAVEARVRVLSRRLAAPGLLRRTSRRVRRQGVLLYRRSRIRVGALLRRGPGPASPADAPAASGDGIPARERTRL